MDARLHRLLRGLPDATWDIVAAAYHLPQTTYHAGQAVAQLSDDFDIPADVRNLAQADHRPDPQALKDLRFRYPKLYEHQIEGVEFGLRAGGRFILADDMGMGKTITALTLVKELNLRRVLVVTPSSVLYKWQDEIGQWLDRPAQIYPSPDPIQLGFVLITWDRLHEFVDELDKWKWQAIIFDESHRMKNYAAQRTKAARKLARGAPHLMFLSGTPIPNRAEELFTTLNAINPVEWKDLPRFRRDWDQPEPPAWVDSPHKLHTIMAERRHALHLKLGVRLKGMMLRRTKDILRAKGQLPARMPDTLIRVPHPGTEYTRRHHELVDLVRSKHYQFAAALVLLGHLRRLVGEAKVPTVVDLAIDRLEASPDHKVLIYANHHHVRQNLEAALEAYQVTSIHGNLSSLERNKRKQLFQSDPRRRVMVITEAGEEGIDLWASNYVLFAELPWTPRAMDQAVGRADRIGQTREVEVAIPLVQGTLDPHLYGIIQRKRRVSKGVLGDDPPRSVIVELLNLIAKED